MADNILTKDRDLADLDIAAKEILGVKFPRNMLTNAAGVDVNPATESTLAALNVIAAAIQSAAAAINSKTTVVNTDAIAGTVNVSGELLDAIQALRMTVQSLSRSVGLVTVDSIGQQRVTMSTIPILTNQERVGGYLANDQITALMRMSAGVLRNNITVN